MPEKRPAIGSGKDYQARLPTAVEVDAWFANAHAACCLICEELSGILELIEFDCAGEAFTAWSTLVSTESPGLPDHLVMETSPSGGWHVVYRRNRDRITLDEARIAKDEGATLSRRILEQLAQT